MDKKLANDLMDSLNKYPLVNVIDKSSNLDSYKFFTLNRKRMIRLDVLYENPDIGYKTKFILFLLKVIAFGSSFLSNFFDFLSLVYIGDDLLDLVSSTRHKKDLIASEVFWLNLVKSKNIYKKGKFKKEVKTIFYTIIDEKTTVEHINNIKTLEILIKNGNIRKTGIVVFSNRLIFPNNNLVIPMNSLDSNDFLHEYGIDILTMIHDKNYVNAINLLNERLIKNQVMKINELHFILQCIAFLNNKSNINSFNSMMQSIGIEDYEDHIIYSVNHFLIRENDNNQVSFYDFVTIYLKELYRNYTSFSQTLMIAVLDYLTATIGFNSEYYLLFEISNKTSHPNSFYYAIISNFYAENLSRKDIELQGTNDYISISNNGLINIYRWLKDDNNIITPEIYDSIIKSINADLVELPYLKLIWYYYLISKLYKASLPVTFLDDYLILLTKNIRHNHTDMNTLFKIQFVLYYSIIEDNKLISKYDRAKSIFLKEINENSDIFNGSSIVSKVYRSAGGLYRNDYQKIYEYNLKAVEASKDNVLEKCMSLNNLSAIEIVLMKPEAYKHINQAMKFKRTINQYRNIKITILSNKLIINFMKYRKLDSTIINQMISLQNMSYLPEYSDCTEEFKHVFVNYIGMQLISNTIFLTYSEILNKYEIEKDIYFKFFYFQSVILFECLFSDSLTTTFINELTVFYKNQKSFLEKKYNLLNLYAKKTQKSYDGLRDFLSDNLKVESLIQQYLIEPYSYSVCERWFE